MKNLFKTSFSVLSNLMIYSLATAQVNTAMLKGSVMNESDEPLPFCTVQLKKGSHLSAGTITDSTGAFHISSIEPGNYSLKISSIGFNSKYIRDIRIDKQNVQIPPIEMSWGVLLSAVTCSSYRPYCIMPCGFGCICLCCMPQAEMDDSEDHFGAIVTVDTTSFLALESWQNAK